MEKRDIEALRERIPCAAVLERGGFAVDLKESTRKAVKYRRGASEIVIVIHGGRGWFDPLSDAKGDVFSLAVHLGAGDFAEALKQVGELVGFIPTQLEWRRPARQLPASTVANRWTWRLPPRPGSSAWRYLTQARAIPDHVIERAVGADRLREGPHGSMWAAHTNDAGAVVGWEERGPEWRGFASGGAKRLFRFGPVEARRVCVTEAAIDALSLAAIEVVRPDTLYVSTGGGWSPATDSAIRALAGRRGSTLVAATDHNRQGEAFAGRLRALAQEAGAAFARAQPRGDDWNEDLAVLMRRWASEPVAATG